MANYYTISWILKILRSLLKDRLQNNNNAPVVFTDTTDTLFTLPDDNVSESTIVIKKNGIILDDAEWSFDSSTNEITVTISVATTDIFTITYSFYEKYSDSELADYIEASLAIFSQYGYRKTFLLSDDETKIVTYNGINPTLKESYEIAIITSINVDPRNINIDTREFKLSAEENKSKSDLIGEAFQKFMNFTGEVSFDLELGEEEVI